jgi:hypothetical protein
VTTVLVCVSCAKPVERTFDDDWQHVTTVDGVACTAWPVTAARVPGCEVDGDTIDTYGGEHYWQCGRPGALTVDGALMCEDHAGERGYGPKQEEYGYDPGDGTRVQDGTED